MDHLAVKNIAYYAFFKPGFSLSHTRALLQDRMQQDGIKGTILLAKEGINCSISGLIRDMDRFLAFLFETIGIPDPEIKISYSQSIPFKRSLVKIKPFIVPMPGRTSVDPSRDRAPYISAETFHQWIKDEKPMVVLDTRNDFEYQAGRFKNSRHLQTRHFADFESDLQQAPPQWKEMPVVTFCTGGIRCEKAAPLMLKHGFKEVYQLQGGILNYFKKMGRGYFEGNCFVFDERRNLDENLRVQP